MSFLTTRPDLLLAAAGRLQAIGAAVTAADSMAAFPITGVVPASAHEISALTAATFAGYGRQYQAISAQAGMIHEQFVRALGAGADSYEAAEAANATQVAGGHLAPAMPAHMVPGGPARTAPAVPGRVAPVAPNRVTPSAPAHPVTAATPVNPGWHGGGYGGHATPQRGGYAGYGAANYGRHQTTYGRGGYRAHPAAPVEHVAHPAHMAPAEHAEHVAPARPEPAEQVARAALAPRHLAPGQLAPNAPARLAAALPAEHVVPMHLPAGAPGEHVVHAQPAFKAAAGPKPVPALA